mgnify:CR=1 FL=1
MICDSGSVVCVTVQPCAVSAAPTASASAAAVLVVWDKYMQLRQHDFRHRFDQPLFRQLDELLAGRLTGGAEHLSCVRSLLRAAGFQ